MRCLNKKKEKKERKSIFQSFMGKPILMYQLKSLLNEISWKFKEATKIYAYDKTLFINLCLQPNLKHEGQINLIYHTSQGNPLYVPFKNRK